MTCENGLMGEGVCRYCQSSFQPSKFQPAQAVCSDPGCQRRRRNDYHRRKVATDAVYRQGAWKARSNGARSIRATGSNCARSILHGRNETDSASGKGTSKGDDAVLPTTTQLWILPTTSQLSRNPLNLKRRLLLANNSPLVKGSPSAP